MLFVRSKVVIIRNTILQVKLC